MIDFLSGVNGITTSVNPSNNTLILIKELIFLFPKTKYFKRKKFKIRQLAYYLKVQKYKNLLILKDNLEKKKELWYISLEKKVTIHFEIVSFLLKKNLGTKGNPSFHRPELILNNFTGKLGNIIANLLKDLFPSKPDFRGRQIITFHMEKNFIFVRFHRYIFSFSRRDVQIQELGPRITLRFSNIFDIPP